MSKERYFWNSVAVLFVVCVLAASSITYFLVIRPGLDERAWKFVSREELELPTDSRYLESAVQAGLWLVNHQLPDGSFRYEYNPVEKTYSNEQSLLRQLGTSASILLLYGNYQERIFLDSGKKACEYVAGHLSYINKDTAYIYGGGEANLGGAALAVMCFYQYSLVAGEEYDDELEALGEFLLFSQNDDGSLRSWYMMGGRVLEPGDEFYGMHTDYYPGEALLAIAQVYDHTRDDRYLECFRDAFDHYYEFYGGDNSPYTPFSPWATGAIMMMYPYVLDQRYVNMSISMADNVLEYQGVYPADFEIESYRGGFYYRKYQRYGSNPDGASASDKAYHPRSNTASKIEGTVDLVWMIRQNGLNHNTQRYADSSFLCADFLSQLQYDKNEAEKYEEPENVIGGVPGGVIDPQIRIDFNQHAMVTWLKVYCFLELGIDLYRPII